MANINPWYMTNGKDMADGFLLFDKLCCHVVI